MRSPHATGGSSRSAPGTPGGAAPPSDWSPARRLAEAAAEEERRERVRQSMLRREAADRDTHRSEVWGVGLGQGCFESLESWHGAIVSAPGREWESVTEHSELLIMGWHLGCECVPKMPLVTIRFVSHR